MRKVPFLSIAPLVLAATCLPGPALAEDGGLRLNGFGTVGLVHLDAPADWALRRAHNQPRGAHSPGAGIDSRLGLQANYAWSPQLELVAQTVLQQQVRADPVELAFVAWRPRPELTIRLGRTNNDVVLLSESRNIGFSYLWARPNHEAYGPMPIFMLDGADATWRWRAGSAYWRLHLFAGEGATRVEGATGQGSQRYEVRGLLGATLSRDEGGLHLRGTVAALRGALGRNAGIDAAMAALGQVAALPVPAVATEAASLRSVLGGVLASQRLTYVAAGLSFDDGGPWLVTAEAIAALSEASFIRGRFAYASVGRRFGDWTLYAMAGVGRFGDVPATLSDWGTALAPVVGPQQGAELAAVADTVQRELYGGAMRQRSLSVGVRWDVHPRAALKMQLDQYSVQRSGSYFWTTGAARAARPLVASAVLDFVF